MRNWVFGANPEMISFLWRLLTHCCGEDRGTLDVLLILRFREETGPA
jgi:hypothetical protein